MLDLGRKGSRDRSRVAKAGPAQGATEAGEKGRFLWIVKRYSWAEMQKVIAEWEAPKRAAVNIVDM